MTPETTHLSHLVTPAQVRAARALLGWSQSDLAKQASVGTSTVADFERNYRTPIANTAAAIKAALEKAGVTFRPGGAVIGPQPALPREASKGGSPPRWIDGTDLSQWGARRDAQDNLPELISRLIRAATGLDARLRLPAKEGIQRPGWDGTCEVECGAPYVPAGVSCWEFGTQQSNIRSKADGDYEKRTNRPLGIDPRQATFTFVTPHRWDGKDAWVTARRAENRWADVNAYDADDLVQWIELYPAVGQWLAVMAGKRPLGLRQLDEVWDEWSLATRVPATPDLILADRDNEATAILRWLKDGRSIMTVQGETAGEAMAFLHAAIWQLPEEYARAYGARCVVAESADAARQLGDSPSPLIIVLEEPDPGLAAKLAGRGHHVYAVYGWSDGIRRDALQLRRASRFSIEPILRDVMGIKDADAARLAAESLGSLTVLRRLMERAPGPIPRWAAGTPSTALLAAMLAGAWNENEEGDKAMVARLAGTDYGSLARELAPWVGAGDSPLRKSGAVWRIASPRDAWFLLARHLSDEDVNRYISVLLDVLGSADPRFDMPPEERWYAAVKGVKPPFSGYMRRGLGETLILLSLFGDRAASMTGLGARVEHVVRKLLDGADGQQWWSLSRDFQLLAEAAPDAFMDALDSAFDSPTPIQALFGEDGGPIFGGEHLSDLLWALETLALDPGYLPRAAILLARLAAIDPGGRMQNRPANSLRDIFIPLKPQTNANVEQRLAVLDAIRAAEPDVGWTLTLGLLATSTVIVGTPPSPRWRDLSGEPEAATRDLVNRQISEISSKALVDVAACPRRWTELLDNLSNLPSTHRKDAISNLTAAASTMDRECRLNVWGRLRHLLNRHRRLAAWRLPRAEIDALDKAYEALRPDDEIDRIAWLFGPNAELPRPQGRDYRKNNELLAVARRDALRRLLTAGSAAAVFALAGVAAEPGLVGATLGELRVAKVVKDEILTDALRSPEPSRQGLAHGLVVRRYEKEGKVWAERLLNKAETEKWGAQAIAQILGGLPREPWVWDRAEANGQDVHTRYWNKVVPLWVDGTVGDISRAVEELIVVGRARHALELAAFKLKTGLSGALLARVLKSALEQPFDKSEDVSGFQYSVEEILTHIDENSAVAPEELAVLEWNYMPLLRYSQRKPRALQAKLAEDPAFFVEVLSALYNPEPGSGISEPAPADQDHAAAVAVHASELLGSWTLVPGTEGAVINTGKLSAWLRDARSKATKVGRGSIADIVIGQMLGRCPIDADGFWPPVAVRDAVETARSRDLERGIFNGRFNNRGVTSRLPGDGGELERKEAAFYRTSAQAIATRWPRTAALLGRLASEYDEMAISHDQDSERREWR